MYYQILHISLYMCVCSQGFLQGFSLGGGGGGNTNQSYNKTSPFLGGSRGMFPQKILKFKTSWTAF